MKKVRVLSLVFVVIALFLAACGGGAPVAEEPAPAQESSSGQGTTDSSASATEAPASEGTSAFFLQIAKVVGTVEVRASAGDEYAPAQEGQRLLVGAQIRTGADGVVALYRDAKTMVIIDSNSEAEIKTLDGTAEVPVTVVLLLSGAAALDHHGEQLAEGAIFRVETPEGNNGGIVGSTVRVQYNPETKVMTATCLTGTCEFVRGDQKLTLQAGQAVDVEGLQPPPGAPEEMSVEQANQFLAMGGQLCGCEIKIGEIREVGLSGAAPAPENLDQPSGETENSNDSSNSNDSNNSNDSSGSSDSGNSNDSGSGDSGGSDSGGSDSGGSDSGSGDSSGSP